MALNPSIRRFSKLSSHRRIATYSYHGRTPPLCQCCNKYAERLFCQSHVGIIEVFIIPVQGHTEELCCDDPMKDETSPPQEEATYEKQQDMKYVKSSNNLKICLGPPCFTSPPGCSSTAFSSAAFTAGAFLCLRVSTAIMFPNLCRYLVKPYTQSITGRK